MVPATVDDDLALPAIEWNGSRFYIERSGSTSGIPIIYLAGGPGNDDSYLSRLTTTCDGQSIGANHPLIFWDQRGTGQSRRHDDSLLNMATFRQDLDGLVELLDPNRTGVILVGHSWGGTFAADFTDRHPERVKGLVLLEPGELTRVLADSNPSSVVTPLDSEWISDFAWGQDVLTIDDHERFDFYALIAARGAQPTRTSREAAPNKRLGAAVVRQSFLGNFYPPNYDFTMNLKKFTTETLLIAGDLATADLGDRLQRRQLDVFAKPTLEVLAGDSHTDVVWADGCKSAALMLAYFRRIGVSP